MNKPSVGHAVRNAWSGKAAQAGLIAMHITLVAPVKATGVGWALSVRAFS
jgi:hypothetical protein